MINILSYVGMNMQSEVCLWALLGLMRTIFDATLFKVNANLKQVWQMSMPEELSMPVQRVLRTMISGIMLVQCFTVYVYLASYIVLLYPVFLEERPTLVLPWLLLAAIRKLLCELTSLALGLGTCVILGAAKPPCIKFLIIKIVAIMPAFYMWMLVYGYYHALKVASAFKTFPTVHQSSGRDYGLELAIRRRRTKSLLGEDQLRQRLVAGWSAPVISEKIKMDMNIPENAVCSDSSVDETPQDSDVMRPPSNKYADIGPNEDWFGSEIIIPRGDRILEQFIVMLLRIGAYFNQDGTESIKSNMFNSALTATWATRENMEAMSADMTDTPPLVGYSKGHTASYLREYPQIFMKKLNGTENTQPDCNATKNNKTDSSTIKNRLRAQSSKSNKSNEMPSSEINKIVSDTAIIQKEKQQSTKPSAVASEELSRLNQIKESSIISDVISDKLMLPEQNEIQQRSNSANSASEKLHEVDQITQNGEYKASLNIDTKKLLISKNNNVQEPLLESSLISEAISDQLILPKQDEIQRRSKSVDCSPDRLHEVDQIKQNGVSRASINIGTEKLSNPDTNTMSKEPLETHSKNSASTVTKSEPNKEEQQECKMLGNDEAENKETMEAGPSRLSDHHTSNQTVNNTLKSQNVTPEKNKKN